MDAEFDLDTESMSDNESADPLIPIWLRQQYTEVDPDLVMTYSSVSTYEKKAAPEQAPEPAPEPAPFVMLPDKKDWYILIDSIDGTRIDYNRKEIKTRLRENILAGMHDKNSSAMIFTKKKPYFLPKKDHWNLDSNWNRKATTLTEFAKKHFALGVLYQPIWSYAKTGLKWGGAIGIILFNIYNIFFFHSTNPFFAVLITIGLIVCFIARYRALSVLLFLFIAARYPDTRIILLSAPTFAFFGVYLCSPFGMAVGGLIGWYQRRSIARAYDAVTESRRDIARAVLLPFLAGCGTTINYLVINLIITYVLEKILEVIEMMYY